MVQGNIPPSWLTTSGMGSANAAINMERFACDACGLSGPVVAVGSGYSMRAISLARNLLNGTIPQWYIK